MSTKNSFPRTLTLYVTTRGITFTLFSGATTIIDWGARHIFTKDKQKHADTVRAAKGVIDQCSPKVLVIENVEDGYSRRSPRLTPLYRAIAAYAEKEKIAVRSYSRRDIKDVFSPTGATNKHHVNCVLAEVVPGIQLFQPDRRKCYQGELALQGMFDAAALGLVFFVRTQRLDIMDAMQKGLPVIDA